ncbi:MAG TPA: hypothetical protein VF103_10185, partial [Polyangiaceae bacterium]
PSAPAPFRERLRNVRAYWDTKRHDGVRQIPRSHRGLPVFTSVRNPYDRYVSRYAFASWKRLDGPVWSRVQKATVLARFPHFPDLSFEEYVELSTTFLPRYRNSPLGVEDRLGWESEELVRSLFRDPEAAWSRLDDTYISNGEWARDLASVTFLRRETLNRSLYDYLVGSGFSAGDVDFVLEEAPVVPKGSRRDPSRSWQDWYTPELMAKVRKHERLLFAMFPEYDDASYTRTNSAMTLASSAHASPDR